MKVQKPNPKDQELGAQLFSLRSIMSLQDLRQNQSPGTVPTCTVVRCFPHDNIVLNHISDDARVLLLIAQASLFTKRATYRHCRTICEQNFSSSLNWCAWCCDLFANSQHRSTHFCMIFHIIGQSGHVCAKFLKVK